MGGRGKEGAEQLPSWASVGGEGAGLEAPLGASDDPVLATLALDNASDVEDAVVMISLLSMQQSELNVVGCPGVGRACSSAMKAAPSTSHRLFKIGAQTCRGPLLSTRPIP